MTRSHTPSCACSIETRQIHAPAHFQPCTRVKWLFHYMSHQRAAAARRVSGCRCRDGKSALPSAHLHDARAVFLLSSGGTAFRIPAMSRERETRRVRKPLILLSSPVSKLLRRFRSRSLMKSVSIDTSCTHESYVDQFDYCGSHGALRCA